MFYGVYLCISGFFILISFLIFPILRKKPVLYIVITIVANLILLVSFEMLTLIFNLRGGNNFDYPGDYTKSGVIGYLILILPVIGIFSPLIISSYLNKTILNDSQPISNG